jgi:hypothetical protein
MVIFCMPKIVDIHGRHLTKSDFDFFSSHQKGMIYCLFESIKKKNLNINVYLSRTNI